MPPSVAAAWQQCSARHDWLGHFGSSISAVIAEMAGEAGWRRRRSR
jgi:hypothetical protein